MLAVQCAVSFMIWLAYGVVLWLRRGRMHRTTTSWSRGLRTLGGAGALVGGAIWLFGGLLVVQYLHGIRDQALTWWAWIAVTAVGLGFVYSQAFAVSMMISVALETDTAKVGESSMMQKTEDIEP